MAKLHSRFQTLLNIFLRKHLCGALRVCLCLCLCFSFSLFVVVPAHAAGASVVHAAVPADQDVQNAVSKVFADKNFQPDFQNSKQPKEFQTYTRSAPAPRYQGSKTNWEPLAWAALVVVAIFIMLAVWRGSVPTIKKSAQVKTTAPRSPQKQAPIAKAAAVDLAAVDRLANEGDLSTAIFLLLTLSVELVRGQFNRDVFLSLTNREILHQAQLPNEAKAAFAQVVSAEELSQFAQQRVNKDVFDLCRASYLSMSQAISLSMSQSISQPEKQEAAHVA